MKVAIVQDWLSVFAGTEMVHEHLLRIFPDATIFAVVDFLSDEDRSRLGGKRAITSFIQKMPLARRFYRGYLPLMPIAVEQWDFSDFDVVISISHTVAKGIITTPNQVHVGYILSPMRYAWDLYPYHLSLVGNRFPPKKWLAAAILHRLRIWDQLSANRVDEFVAISEFVARRVEKTYRRRARVIYPPVDTAYFSSSGQGEDYGNVPDEDYYVTVSRLVPYKRVDLLARAFAELPDRKLIIVGDGPERRNIEKLCPPNVTLCGRRPRDEVRALIGQAKAFLFCAVEDFGIAPLEAQACGVPVIALRQGAALETLNGLDSEDPTAVFFDHQTTDDLVAAIRRFERDSSKISAESCRRNANRFSSQRFCDEFEKFVRESAADLA